jgi:hypothetical protein
MQLHIRQSYLVKYHEIKEVVLLQESQQMMPWDLLKDDCFSPFQRSTLEELLRI